MSSNLNISTKSSMPGSKCEGLNASLASMLQSDRARSRSRSVNTSFAWSSLDGVGVPSSPDTLSLTLSEVESNGLDRLASPDHLVSRRSVLDRIGVDQQTPDTMQSSDCGPSLKSQLSNRSQHASFRSCGSEDDFYLNWRVSGSRPGQLHRQASYHHHQTSSCSTDRTDRLSISSGDSGATAHSNYDQPKTVLKVTSSPICKKKPGQLSPTTGRPHDFPNFPRNHSSNEAPSINNASEIHRMVTAKPCKCDPSSSGYGNYDIPRSLHSSRQVY